MARKKKQDQLTPIGFLSVILRQVAQQRSLAKGRDKRSIKAAKKAEKALAKKRKELEPKDKRTPAEIRASVALTRSRLDATVGVIKTDLSLPTRARIALHRVSGRLPESWKGEPRATVVAASVLASGAGAVAVSALAGIRVSRHRRAAKRAEALQAAAAAEDAASTLQRAAAELKARLSRSAR